MPVSSSLIPQIPHETNYQFQKPVVTFNISPANPAASSALKQYIVDLIWKFANGIKCITECNHQPPSTKPPHYRNKPKATKRDKWIWALLNRWKGAKGAAEGYKMLPD